MAALVKNVGPSGVRALPLGVAAERSVHYIVPSEVRETSGANLGGHYFRYFALGCWHKRRWPLF